MTSPAKLPVFDRFIQDLRAAWAELPDTESRMKRGTVLLEALVQDPSMREASKSWPSTVRTAQPGILPPNGRSYGILTLRDLGHVGVGASHEADGTHREHRRRPRALRRPQPPPRIFPADPARAVARLTCLGRAAEVDRVSCRDPSRVPARRVAVDVGRVGAQVAHAGGGQRLELSRVEPLGLEQRALGARQTDGPGPPHEAGVQRRCAMQVASGVRAQFQAEAWRRLARFWPPSASGHSRRSRSTRP